jgi:hypothetical protein
MTPDGVTHVRPGMPSKFTALAEWMRESSLFNALSVLPFMHNFYLAKAHSQFSSSLRRSACGVRDYNCFSVHNCAGAFDKSKCSVERLSMYGAVEWLQLRVCAALTHVGQADVSVLRQRLFWPGAAQGCGYMPPS